MTNATHFDGDLSIGRNIAAGGNMTLQGSSHVKGGMQVDGWLVARNIMGVNKGVFTSLEKLNATYPEPRDGWYAVVGTSLPGPLYVADGGEWVPTGGTGGYLNDIPLVSHTADGLMYASDKVKIDRYADTFAENPTATDTTAGLMSAEDKKRLGNSTSYTHPTGGAASKPAALYRFSTDATSHIAYVAAVKKEDIVALGIPAQDTTYNDATETSPGLMSPNDKRMLRAAANGARFDGFVDSASISMVSVLDPEGIYFVKSAGRFAAKSGQMYCNNWNGIEAFMTSANGTVLKDKVYLCGTKAYAWDDTLDTLDTVTCKYIPATARFSSVVDMATVQMMSSTVPGGSIVYVRSAKAFAYFVGGKYYSNWKADGVPPSELYTDFDGFRNDRIYICGSSLYVWDESEGGLVKTG